MCMGALPAYIAAPEKGVKSPGTGVTEDCEPPCGWGEDPPILWKNRTYGV